MLSTLKTLALVSHAHKLRSKLHGHDYLLPSLMHMLLRYVETKYKLEIGAAQSTQLAKAISTGADKGVFVLPKGVLRSNIF